MRWAWIEGCRFSADPQRIGDAMEALGRKLGRSHELLTAEDVVREARDDERSPFRDLLEWDDETAAHHHRLEQARFIIRSCRPVVICNGEPKRVMGFVNVRTEGGERGYVMMDKVARNVAMNSDAIRAARAGLEGWRDRYEQITGFDKVLAWIDRALAEIRRMEELEAKAKPEGKRRAAPTVHA